MSSFEDKFKTIYNLKCNNYKYLPNKLPPVKRIIAIGDVHGDLKLVYKILQNAKVLVNNNWTTNKKYRETVVVQLGDQIDNCRPDQFNTCNTKNYTKNDSNDDLKILKFFTNLHSQAQIYGGAVYSILGNHELMNVNGDYTYVSYENLNDTNFQSLSSFTDPTLARQDAFKPGNKIANFLACTRKTALIIGNNIFVHAGIVPEIAKKYDINDINSIVGLYLFNELNTPNDYNDILNSPDNSPLWNRLYGKKLSIQKCNEIGKSLELYNVNNMFVGHNPQIDKGINSICNNHIWRTDIGMSDAFNKFHNNKTIECLEILTDLKTNKQKFNVLKFKK